MKKADRFLQFPISFFYQLSGKVQKLIGKVQKLIGKADRKVELFGQLFSVSFSYQLFVVFPVACRRKAAAFLWKSCSFSLKKAASFIGFSGSCFYQLSMVSISFSWCLVKS